MAVAIMMDFPGATLEQYDQVIDRMGLTPGEFLPARSFTGWRRPIRASASWTCGSRRSSSTSSPKSRSALTTSAVGIAEPKRTVHEVHNHLIPS